jgi:DnaJ-domain-containing protein 1
MYEMYTILLRKTSELFGQTRTREIYDQAIECLPQNKVKDACVKYAKMETMLGEVDRARAIYTHASQFCDPRQEEDFWKVWRSFEVQHGNEDTFRDMLRVKRSVQAMFAQVHFNATDIAAEEGNTDELDPMQAAERALKSDEDKKRLAGGALEGDAKRARTSAGTARKELIGTFYPSDRWTGKRPGFVFKLGVKGVGYYEDASIQEIEARARAAEQKERAALNAEAKASKVDNPEEIELDMDLDDEEEGDVGASGSAAPAAAAAPAPGNSEEIELNFEDIEEQPIPQEVFGGSLSGVRAAMPAEEVEEPPLAETAQQPGRGEDKQQSLGALARFQARKGKGKGKGKD